ncbi:F0F1 ATP synthase subunit B [Lentibacter sp. XHP0401]|uniref:F0F1 ATP synthase subunit B family protein n=1 Tax=Lentibacter sp. XHP0401 TaxID=2984334 RepID=UPI0021E90371|nr:F0F1 ATP synthase subunit B [Lentibacter sp. XHP0401]MCV2892098.1 F0F1 ATP synthase subunit B [Lentibacter sp. XHP0401]
MSIDWITVAAQVVNFLVLVWLLKRFLYRPILDGIDAREAEIADRMAEAVEAGEKARATEGQYRDQLASLHANEATMADRALRKARDERDVLLANAHARLEQERQDWNAHLAEEGRKYTAELHQAGAGALMSLTRKALDDLADETLEERIVAHVATRLRPMSVDLRKAAGADAEAIATTHNRLPKAARDRLKADLQEVIPDVPMRFETDATQAPGLILRMGGAQVAWTVDAYIDELDALLEEQLAAGGGVRGQGDGH